MIEFDEAIWEIDPATTAGSQVCTKHLVYSEMDVNYDELSLPHSHQVETLIRSLLGQDAHCHDTNTALIRYMVLKSPTRILALASTSSALYTIYLIFRK